MNVNEDVFEKYKITHAARDIVVCENVFISNFGLCYGIKGIDERSYHRGYPGLGFELTRSAIFQAIRHGISFKQINSSGILFHNSWSSGYYHWLIEAMPRLIALKREWGKIPIIIPKNIPNNWFKGWLKQISEGNLISINSGALFLKKVLYQDNPEKMSSYTTTDLVAVSDYFISLAQREVNNHYYDNKIYITRSNAGHRKISNESNVIDLVTQLGYKVYHLEKLSFLQQVAIFSNAKSVVSIHGAGLSNILFMRPSNKVIELIQRPDNKLTWGKRRGTYLLNPCFKALADARSLDYNHLLCEFDLTTTTKNVIRKYGELHGNIKVNIDALGALLEEKIHK